MAAAISGAFSKRATVSVSRVAVSASSTTRAVAGVRSRAAIASGASGCATMVANSARPASPEKPRAAKIFPMLMMMGWMILLIGLIWAIANNGTVTAYWSNSIATTLNPAAEGSALLNQLGVISGVKPWLAALRYLGMAMLFLGITVALTVIIRTLQHQDRTLRSFIKARTAA